MLEREYDREREKERERERERERDPLIVFAYQGPNLETFSEMTDKGGKVANYWAREFGHHAL
jgi:hypothetical protein